MKGRLIMSYLSVAIVGVTFELRVLFMGIILILELYGRVFFCIRVVFILTTDWYIGVKRLKLHWHMPCIFSMHGINF